MISWDIRKSDWPWNETHGQNQSIVISKDGREICTMAMCEVIESAGNKFVSAHLKECQQEIRNFLNT